MAYILGENKPDDPGEHACPFCRIPKMDDAEGLVIHRGEHTYVVLNLYPYAPGHLMVCPYRHIAQYTETSEAEMVEMGQLTKRAMEVLRSASECLDGFNIGMNPKARSGSRHRRPPAPARRTQMARRPELHADHRQDPHLPPTAPRHPRIAPFLGVVGLRGRRPANDWLACASSCLSTCAACCGHHHPPGRAVAAPEGQPRCDHCGRHDRHLHGGFRLRAER
ncbi:MAG: HIT domain-containing protein [Marmoricola sp.]